MYRATKNHCVKSKKPFLVLFLFLLSLTILSQENQKEELKFNSIQPNINTTGSEFSPTVNAEGNVMIFNKKSPNQRYSDLYISIKKNGKWQKEKPLTDLNSKFSDEAPYLSLDGNLLFFSSDRDGSFEMPKNSRGQIKVSYDLYWSRKTENGWSRAVKIPGNVNSMHHERSPSYDSKRQMLFFSRWPFGDFTKANIMASKWKDNSFETPIRLPKSINSGNMEAGFTPAGNSRGYYFASKRPNGMGGWDIYYTAWKNQKYEKPINMGPKINSKNNEIYLLSRANSVYLCSNRIGSLGEYDIFSTDLGENINLKIINKKTGKPISIPAVVFYNKKKKNMHSTENGDLVIELSKEVNAQLQVKIEEKGYLPFQKKFKNLNKKIHVIKLIPIEENKSFIANNIHFDYNSAILKKESYLALDSLVKYLNKNLKLSLQIIGHTDRHASIQYNKKLSLKRARAVKDYFVSKGLKKARFKIFGEGFSNPLSLEKSDRADHLNRRTEFKIISIKQ